MISIRELFTEHIYMVVLFYTVTQLRRFAVDHLFILLVFFYRSFAAIYTGYLHIAPLKQDFTLNWLFKSDTYARNVSKVSNTIRMSCCCISD